MDIIIKKPNNKKNQKKSTFIKLTLHFECFLQSFYRLALIFDLIRCYHSINIMSCIYLVERSRAFGIIYIYSQFFPNFSHFSTAKSPIAISFFQLEIFNLLIKPKTDPVDNTAELKSNLEALKLELIKLKDAAKVAEQNLAVASAKVTSVNSMVNRNPLVMVLIDGDSIPFYNHLVFRLEAGAEEAVELLGSGINLYIDNRVPGVY